MPAVHLSKKRKVSIFDPNNQPLNKSISVLADTNPSILPLSIHPLNDDLIYFLTPLV